MGGASPPEKIWVLGFLHSSGIPYSSILDDTEWLNVRTVPAVRSFTLTISDHLIRPSIRAQTPPLCVGHVGPPTVEAGDASSSSGSSHLAFAAAMSDRAAADEAVVRKIAVAHIGRVLVASGTLIAGRLALISGANADRVGGSIRIAKDVMTDGAVHTPVRADRPARAASVGGSPGTVPLGLSSGSGAGAV